MSERSTTRPPMHDDRSTGASEASRRGAHRARTKALSAGLPVLAGIAVILLVVGGIYVVLGNRGGSPSSDDTTVAAEPTPTDTLPSADATTGPSAETPATSAAAQPSRSRTTPADPGTGPAGSTGNVDKSISVVVLNSTGVKGLAARGESALTTKGWNVTRTGNSINKGLSTTKIYYGDADNEETAQAVQSDLGYGQVFQDSSVTRTGVTVVLGHDAE
jgi:LytR cell envelope-related transcriptional attenuator